MIYYVLVLFCQKTAEIYIPLSLNCKYMMNQNSSGFLSSIPMVTKNLIIINLLFWVASLVLPKVGIDLVQLFGLHFPGVKDFYPFQFVTYMFMHDTHSFAHVFFNMFGVYMFGRVLGAEALSDLLHGDGYWGGYYAGTGLAVFRPFLRKCERGYSGTVGCRRSFIELSDYDRCFWFRVRYFAGICHVVPECSAVPDVHPYSYQGKIFRDLLRIGRIVYGCR